VLGRERERRRVRTLSRGELCGRKNRKDQKRAARLDGISPQGGDSAGHRRRAGGRRRGDPS